MHHFPLGNLTNISLQLRKNFWSPVQCGLPSIYTHQEPSLHFTNSIHKASGLGVLMCMGKNGVVKCASLGISPCLVPAVAANDAATKVVAASVVTARGCVELGIAAGCPVAHASSVGDALTVVVIMRAVHKALGIVCLKRKDDKLEGAE